VGLVGRALAEFNSPDKSVWLLVREIACRLLYKETSPLNYLSSDGSTSSANSTFFSPTRVLALTLLRLRAHPKGLAKYLLPILLLAPGMALAQTTEQPSADIQQRERIEQQLKELRDQQQALLNSMQKQVSEFNARIAAMEAELGVAPPKDQPAQADSGAESSAPLPASAQDVSAQSNPDDHGSTAALATPANSIMDVRGVRYLSEKQQGLFPYEPGKGFVLARGPNGEVDFFVKGYVRYLNQLGLDRFYTDAFGRTFELDLRQDIQLNRLQWGLHGWLFDPRFRYFWYAWTQNVSQGDPAQVVVGGNIAYKFDDALTATAGIFSLPSTRSTAQSFPNWLRIDHRSMADEYFRGSYIQGYMASGELTDTLDYKVALAGNLSALGVSASQLDNCLCTMTSMLYWMPTTGEFGPGNGFGDYEYHEKLATLLGVHFTYSREDAQEQPGVNAFENSQIRLSDGTLLFSPNAFNTGGMINKATFSMLDLDAGLKWRGWSLEAEYYFRWLDDFKVTGSIPVASLFDHGFQVYASTMLKPNYWQAYFSGSKIFGEYGDPWDAAVGLTYFPYGRKEVRMNAQALYMDRSAVGYTAVPYVVGGTGWVYTVDVGTWF
jgi:hypothetical protein